MARKGKVGSGFPAFFESLISEAKYKGNVLQDKLQAYLESAYTKQEALHPKWRKTNRALLRERYNKRRDLEYHYSYMRIAYQKWSKDDGKLLMLEGSYNAAQCTSKDCLAIKTNAPDKCGTKDYRAIFKQDSSLCETQRCKALIGKDPKLCSDKDSGCKSIINGFSERCKTNECRALLEEDYNLCGL